MLLNVAVEGVSIKALHNDAAFLLELDTVSTSLALENATKDLRCAQHLMVLCPEGLEGR